MQLALVLLLSCMTRICIKYICQYIVHIYMYMYTILSPPHTHTHTYIQILALVGVILASVAFGNPLGWYIFVGVTYLVYIFIVFVIEVFIPGIYVHRLIVRWCKSKNDHRPFLTINFIQI